MIPEAKTPHLQMWSNEICQSHEASENDLSLRTTSSCKDILQDNEVVWKTQL